MTLMIWIEETLTYTMVVNKTTLSVLISKLQGGGLVTSSTPFGYYITKSGSGSRGLKTYLAYYIRIAYLLNLGGVPDPRWLSTISCSALLCWHRWHPIQCPALSHPCNLGWSSTFLDPVFWYQVNQFWCTLLTSWAVTSIFCSSVPDVLLFVLRRELNHVQNFQSHVIIHLLLSTIIAILRVFSLQ